MDTVLELLASQARTRGAEPAILALHQAPLRYRALYEQVEAAGATLAGMGPRSLTSMSARRPVRVVPRRVTA